MTNIIIIGASGHGKVVADIVAQAGDRVIGFLDDNPELPETFVGYPMLGSVCDYSKYANANFVIAIGNASVREKISLQLAYVNWYTAVHPTAVISPMGTSVGEGTVVMAHAVINPGSKIGRHCIVNTGATVDHDNVIEDFTHISVGAKLAGTVHVGKRTWVGVGAAVSNNVNICGDCIIGAGAVVVKDISKSGTYVGVPARKIK